MRQPSWFRVADAAWALDSTVTCRGPQVGRGDSINALADSVNGLYKIELIYGPDQGPWKMVGDVELATLSWAHWFNNQGLHGYLREVLPAE